MARNAYILLKGELSLYKKLQNDDLRDTNSRRKEQRAMSLGQTVTKPKQKDKKWIEPAPEHFQKQVTNQLHYISKNNFYGQALVRE